MAALLSDPLARTAIFVDGPNLHLSAKKLGFEIDFRRLLMLFQQGCRLVRVLYYTPVLQSDEFQGARPLIDWLDYNGFTTVTKIAKEYSDESGPFKVKGNMRVELAVDAVHLAPHVDHIVLFSGVGEFQYLVASLKSMGKRVTVVSTLRTEIPMISDELRREADLFVDLSDLETKFGRRQKWAQSRPETEYPLPAWAIPKAILDKSTVVEVKPHLSSSR